MAHLHCDGLTLERKDKRQGFDLGQRTVQPFNKDAEAPERLLCTLDDTVAERALISPTGSTP